MSGVQARAEAAEARLQKVEAQLEEAQQELGARGDKAECLQTALAACEVA